MMEDSPDEEFLGEVVSPLQKSLINGSIDKIKKILSEEYGANLSSQTDEKINEYQEIVQVCLDLKVDVNLQETKYSALLHFVVVNDLDEGTLKMVLRGTSGFDINALCKGRALFHFVLRKNNLAKDLLEFGADINIKNFEDHTLLDDAVSSNFPESVRFLLDNGAKADKQLYPLEDFFFDDNNKDRTVRDKEILIMLLEAGCDVRAENNGILSIDKIFNTSALDIFDSMSNVYNWEIAKLLCAHGADMNLKNETGTKLLHSFCEKGLLDEVYFALKYGADLFSMESGTTTLHKAVLGNNLDLVDFLLCKGLDINAKDDNSESPLHQLPFFMLLDCDCDTGRGPECNRENRAKKFVTMVEFLVDNGADVNVSNRLSLTPLRIISMCDINIHEILECFLELKANVDTQDPQDFFLNSLSSSDEGADNNSTRNESLELLIAFLAMKTDNISQYFMETSDFTEFKWVELFFNKCKTEFNEMKKRKICRNKNVYFFDFLSKDLMEVVRFCRSDEIMLVLETGEYKKEFPSYEYLLSKRVERVQLLRNYLNVLPQFLTKNFNKEFPSVVLDRIISFLNAGNLRNFGRALKITKDFPNGGYCPRVQRITGCPRGLRAKRVTCSLIRALNYNL